MEHDFVLAEIEGGSCGGCEEAEPPSHETAAAAYQREATVHTRLAERQDKLAEYMQLLTELLEQVD